MIRDRVSYRDRHRDRVRPPDGAWDRQIPIGPSPQRRHSPRKGVARVAGGITGPTDLAHTPDTHRIRVGIRGTHEALQAATKSLYLRWYTELDRRESFAHRNLTAVYGVGRSWPPLVVAERGLFTFPCPAAITRHPTKHGSFERLSRGT